VNSSAFALIRGQLFSAFFGSAVAFYRTRLGSLLTIHASNL